MDMVIGRGPLALRSCMYVLGASGTVPPVLACRAGRTLAAPAVYLDDRAMATCYPLICHGQWRVSATVAVTVGQIEVIDAIPAVSHLSPLPLFVLPSDQPQYQYPLPRLVG